MNVISHQKNFQLEDFQHWQVIERCLFFKDYKTSDVQGTVSKELFDLWLACNVYPVSHYMP